MLGKLLKYETKATSRILLPLYAVLLIYSVIHKSISFVTPNKWELPEALSMFVYAMIFIGVFVITIVVIIQRFYKNLLSDEGYLMFTLPTKAWMHITSKLTTSMVWVIASVFAAFISIFIVSYSQSSIESLEQIFNTIIEFFNYFGASSILLVFEALLGVLLSLALTILMIYASIAIGHLARQHKILASLGAYIGLYTISQFISSILFIIGSMIPVPGGSFTQLITSGSIFHVIIWTFIIINGAMAAGCFITSNYILSRHLNLE